MSNTRPQRRTIGLKGTPFTREYHTFEDWQAEQSLDARTAEERGIHVGSSVMWRHRNGSVIITDRATVVAVSHDELTLLVKDVQAHTCHAHVHEIVDNQLGHLMLDGAKRPAALANQVEAPAAGGHGFHLATSANW
jgi:hypothetical protein